MQRIAVSLIAGFLGSGKTTLLNRWLRLPEAGRTAVVVNEFGEIGLDHDLIAASDDNVILLKNGCLCCAMRGDLVTALDLLYRKGLQDPARTFDRVAIETSGLADPGPVIQLLLSEPSIAARYRLDGVVTVVDSVNGEATLDAHLESIKQVAVADRILFSKGDLPFADGGASAAALRRRVKAINPAARLIEADEALPAGLFAAGASRDPDALLKNWLRADAYEDASAATAGHPHDERFRSFCYVRQTPISEAALALFLTAISDNLGPQLLRIKGIINVLERPETPALIHGAQKLLHDLDWLEEWPSADRNSRIVFITLDAGRPLVEELMGFADRIAAGTVRARLNTGQDR